MGDWARRATIGIRRGLLWTPVVVITLAVGILTTFVPLSFLPVEFRTDFVNGHVIDVAAASFLVGMLTLRLTPLARDNDQKEPSFVLARRFIWAGSSGMMLGVWPLALLTWCNAYGSLTERSHEMTVIGTVSTSIRQGTSPIEDLRLRERSTGWIADLPITEERKSLLRVGSCVRIAVREGRLGLDWISDVQTVGCRR
jgi:hypothetical protein